MKCYSICVVGISRRFSEASVLPIFSDITSLWARFLSKMETSNRGRHITPPDPLHDVALISVATTPFRVVISGASTPTVSVGANRNHVHDSSAMWTLLAHLSHLLGFSIVSSCFFVGIPCLQTRTVSPWYDSCHHSD